MMEDYDDADHKVDSGWDDDDDGDWPDLDTAHGNNIDPIREVTASVSSFLIHDHL